MTLAPQHRIGACRFEKQSQYFDQRIEPGRNMFHVNIYRLQLKAQAQLRVITEWRAGITSEPVGQRPIQQIAKRDVIKIQLVRDRVIQTDIVIVECSIPNRAKTKCDCATTLSPNEIAEFSRRASPGLEKIFACENLELNRAGLSDGEIKRINFINDLLRIRPNLERKRRRCVRGRAKFPAQIFSSRPAQLQGHVFIERREIELESYRRKTRDTSVAPAAEVGKGGAHVRRKMLEGHQGD